jgi:hypothetical protein
MKTDEISDLYADKSVGLVLRLLDDEIHSPSTVLIEGSPEALTMLAKLLVAVASEPENDGYGISPFGAGKVHFGKAAQIGVYIHRIDGA